MFELFQYTVCRLLALDRCKFVSASVMRLRENVVRAIIPPVLVHPWFSSLPSASPLLLSQATCRSQHPSGQKDLFKFPAALMIRATSERLRVPQLKSHRDETHLGIFTRATSILTSVSCPLRTFKSHLLFGRSAFSKRNNTRATSNDKAR